MFTKHDPDDFKPCPHMETLVSAWVDGALTGLMGWYTQWHVSHCSRCADAVPVLRVLRARLRQFSEPSGAENATLTPERQVALEAAWEQADHVSASPPAP